jgi:hypothetical protein
VKAVKLLMTPKLKSLILQLSERGISPNHVPALIRNVLHIIGGGGLFTTKMVNEHLQQLGWGPDALDETSFQLIVYILESEWGYRVNHYNVSSMDVEK